MLAESKRQVDDLNKTIEDYKIEMNRLRSTNEDTNNQLAEYNLFPAPR